MGIIKLPVLSGRSKILIGEKIQNLKKYIPEEKIIIITDINVNNLYSKYFPSSPIIKIGIGEKIKNLITVQDIYEKLIDFKTDRSFFIIGIGGGLVCDITGFVASTYMRGLRFGFVSTTLLSQVDAGIGGKNGINFLGYKNLVGLFSQPEFIICDINTLSTLKDEEYFSGFAEIIKYAIIRDSSLFKYLEDNYKKALEKDYEVIGKLIYDSLLIKASIVSNDEKEKGERKILNFGHTFSHAIEKSTGIIHGQAVSIGMVLALKISEQKGLITKDKTDRIKSLLTKYKLPLKTDFNKKDVFEVLKMDKKRDGNYINFILIEDIGKACIVPILINEIKDIFYDLR